MRRIELAFVAAIALLAASCGQASAPSEEQSEPNASASNEAATTGPTAEDRVFCAEVGRRISPADCEVYVALAQSAQRGVAAFNAPDPMRRGQLHTLQLAISFAPPEPPPAAVEPAPGGDDQQRGVSTGDSETPAPPSPPPAPASQTPQETVEDLPGETREFQPLVGRFMRAELQGVGFDITEKSPASQEVTPDSVTTWTWEVVARQGGARSLTLHTVVEGCTEDGRECVPLRSTTQNYTVNVEVGPVDRVKDFLLATPDWIKIVTAIVAALAGLIGAWIGLRNAFRKSRGSD
ncbi:hypothetical protein [Terricaulis sp.]|uniref:hypothetical protein n=1 Tax=Terricaulis sp. TaxID=2768686 RepID=UPI003784CABA